MNTIFSALPALAVLNLDFATLIPVVAIVMPFLMIISIQVAKSIARTQQERMRCEVIRTAIERGQPVPAEALKPLPEETEAAILAEAKKAPTPQFDIRTGLICIGVGLGLFIMFSTFQIGNFDSLQGLRWVSAVPGFVGVALIVNGLINRPAPAPLAAPARPADRSDASRI